MTLRSIGVQLVDDGAAAIEIGEQRGQGIVLYAIRPDDRARHDEAAIEVECHALLEAVERLAAGLATVTHVRARDRHAAVLGHAVS